MRDQGSISTLPNSFHAVLGTINAVGPVSAGGACLQLFPMVTLPDRFNFSTATSKIFVESLRS
jgi:hypothetical protein